MTVLTGTPGEISEAATVLSDRDVNVMLEVNPDPDHMELSYFKLYNSCRKCTATKVAKISFFRLEYVCPARSERFGPKEAWVLNDAQKRTLIRLLKGSSRFLVGFTVWEALIIVFNWELGARPDETKDNCLPHPKNPAILPFNLRMPDYTKLR